MSRCREAGGSSTTWCGCRARRQASSPSKADAFCSSTGTASSPTRRGGRSRRVEAGEDPIEAGRREMLEETGWRPGPLSQLFSYFPAAGLIDQRFNIILADGAEHIGEPSDASESDRVEWIALSELPGLIRRGEIQDGYSLTALLWLLHFGSQTQGTET